MGSKKARPAARLGDIGSNHGKFPPTPIIQGSLNVFINGRPAARKGDSLQPVAKKRNYSIGYTRPDTGRCTMWLTTYEQLRAADLSPEHIAAMLGMDYDPEQQYELYIYDQGEDAAENGATCFIPTYERMAEAGVVEFKCEHDEQLLRDVMTEDVSIEYAKAMEAFWETGKNQFEEDDIRAFVDSYFTTTDEKDAFRTRHYYRTQFGCNSDFLGNGATRWKEIAIPHDDGSVLRQSAPQQYGAVELLVIEKNPPSIEKLIDSGQLRILPTEAIPPYTPPTGA